jgi:CheY-like chemotaxis protein
LLLLFSLARGEKKQTGGPKMSEPKKASALEKKPVQSTASTDRGAIQPSPKVTPDDLAKIDKARSTVEALAKLFPPQNVGRSNGKAEPAAPKSAPNRAKFEVIDLSHLSSEQFESFFPSENAKPKAQSPAPARSVTVSPKEPVTITKKELITNAKKEPVTILKSTAVAKLVQSERRAKRRALISAPIRVRSIDLTGNSLDEITTTLNVSRQGILIASTSPVYNRGMDVMVTFPHSKAPNSIQSEQPGRVVHVAELASGSRSVAITLNVTHRQEDFIRTSGVKVHAEPDAAKASNDQDPKSLRPLVLAVDSEASARGSLKSYLSSEGYDVVAVANVAEAREVLSRRTPSLLIAEFEGVGMPGYDICSHCKSNPRLQNIPVILTTTSAYPSDYASAHSLGAVVCIAKPYRQERLIHVVRLLAPPHRASEKIAAPQPADTARHRPSNGKVTKPAPIRRFRFGTKT